MRGLSHRVRSVARIVPIVIVVVVLALFSVVQTVDLAHQQIPGNFAQSLLAADPATARYTLTSIACALSTVLAITITLALIVVELTASRYTPKLIDLFIEAKANQLGSITAGGKLNDNQGQCYGDGQHRAQRAGNGGERVASGGRVGRYH